MMEKYNNQNISWIKNEYWYLEEVSCVLVLRNHMWFESVIGEFKEIWNTIVQERVTGYTHRKPNKRNVKKNESSTQVIKISDTFEQNIEISDTSISTDGENMNPNVETKKFVITIDTSSV